MKSTALIVSSVLVLVLVGANIFAGKWFFSQAIPNTRTALQSHLGVEIDTSLTGVWTSATKSTGQRGKWWHSFAIPGTHLLLMIGFIVFLLVQFLLFFLVARKFSS